MGDEAAFEDEGVVLKTMTVTFVERYIGSNTRRGAR